LYSHITHNLSLRPATGADLNFSETLSRDNMRGYRAAQGIDWDPERYRASWAEFENLVIEVDGAERGALCVCLSDPVPFTLFRSRLEQVDFRPRG
jgi:hypothetical protein